MNDMPSANLKPFKSATYSSTWVVPAIALLASVFLLASWQMNKGPLVTIDFDDANGLTSDSPIMYRGAIIGRVETITLKEDHSKITVDGRLHQSASSLAVTGSQWWIVRPSISLQSISGLDTIVGPRYIEVAPGNGEPMFAFQGENDAVIKNGKQFTIITSSSEGISTGAPIFYRGIEIGSITKIDLAKDTSTVHLQFSVQHSYAPIIRTDTVFWNESGIYFNASITGFKLHAGPLASLVRGGVSLATPTRFGDLAPEGFAFTLHEESEDEWLEWTPMIELTEQVTVE